jgi:hypothetical protein
MGWLVLNVLVAITGVVCTIVSASAARRASEAVEEMGLTQVRLRKAQRALAADRSKRMGRRYV